MSVNYIDKSTGDLIRVAGQGKAEYGASTERKGDITIPATTAGNFQTVNVVFAQAMPDNDYAVVIDEGTDTWAHCSVNVTNKTTTGFTLFFVNITAADAPQMTFKYRAFKLYTDTEYNNLLNNAVLTSDVTDEVTNGDMNPVTSNAVAEAISQIKSETKAKYKALSFNSIPGVTFAKRDNNPKALSATRVDNIIVLNYSITIQGTYTGTSHWLPIFSINQLDSLLDDGEALNYSVTPYFCSGITYTNDANYVKLDGVMDGYLLYFYNGAVINMGIQGQVILGVQKTS